MAVKEIDNSNFEAAISQDSAVIYFFSPEDAVCLKFNPVVEEVSNELTGIKFYKVNFSLNKELAAKYKVVTIPSILLFKKGQLLGMGEGADEKDVLKNHLEQAMKNGSN